MKWLGCLLCLTKARDFARSQACQTTQHSTHKKAQCFPNGSCVQIKTRILVISVAIPLIWKHLCISITHSVATCQCESVDRGLSFAPAQPVFLLPRASPKGLFLCVSARGLVSCPRFHFLVHSKSCSIEHSYVTRPRCDVIRVQRAFPA